MSAGRGTDPLDLRAARWEDLRPGLRDEFGRPGGSFKGIGEPARTLAGQM